MVKTIKSLRKVVLFVAFALTSSMAFAQEFTEFRDPSYTAVGGLLPKLPLGAPLLSNQLIRAGNSVLRLQADGNLVFIQDGVQVWESQTANQGVTQLNTGLHICLVNA